MADLVDRRIRADLIGRGPLMRELLWHRLWELDRIEELPIYALGLVDVALWDLAGKAPGCRSTSCSAPSATPSPPTRAPSPSASIEEYLDVADQCLELGYPAIKLHAWGDARAGRATCARSCARTSATTFR